LPILLLVSEERNTGKSTFLNFLKAVFENNVTFNTNEDFRSQFNSDWAGKLLIMVDEVLLNRREDSERLKNSKYHVLLKGRSKRQRPFRVAFFASSYCVPTMSIYPYL
jgi:phage/plasmid-associated DNA primase